MTGRSDPTAVAPALPGLLAGQRRPGGGRILREAPPRPFEAATSSLEALYPFQTSTVASAGGRGMAIGPSVTGGVWCFDPWTLYADGLLDNPNILVLGDVGSGKSSLVKTLVWRGLEFGRGAHILDPKGEYGPLAAAAGTEPVVLRPGGGVVLNPLDPGTSAATLSPPELFQRNLATLRALAEAALGRPLTQLEMVLLSAALARVTGIDHPDDQRLPLAVPTLVDVTEALVTPPDDLPARVNMPAGRVTEESREVALALVRLVDPDGDLGGMFAGTTTLDPAQLGQLVVLDLSAVHRTHRHALPLVMICAAAWLQTACETGGRGRFQVNDEAWALLSDPAAARWMQANQKLARQLGLSVVNVLHRLSDTAATGDAGTAVRSLADGVIADAGTWIIHRQKTSERPLLADTLQLTDLQTDLVTRLGRGRALWVVGGERRDVALVDHVLSDIEHTIVDTDQHMTTDARQFTNREDAAEGGRPT